MRAHRTHLLQALRAEIAPIFAQLFVIFVKILPQCLLKLAKKLLKLMNYTEMVIKIAETLINFVSEIGR